MLVLTRRLGESICINDDIKIVIQSIKDHQVRIGISAPRETLIHREEIYQKMQKENKQAVDLPTEMESLGDLYRTYQETN
jgi:carbon storage regulator